MRPLLLLLLLTLIFPAYAESPEPPLTLPAATSAEEVESFLLMPKKFALSGVKRGYLRYIAQNEAQDSNFRTGYWLGGPLDSDLDLTLKRRADGKAYPFHVGTMCSRAAYSMALSYLGVDLSPGAMSKMMNARNLEEPYDMISAQVGVERITAAGEKNLASAFADMMANYAADPDYSPVYLYFKRPNDTTHAVLVVGSIPETGRYLVVDSNALRTGGHLYRVYFISLNPQRSEIINSTFANRLNGSRVLQLDQWRLVEKDE